MVIIKIKELIKRKSKSAFNYIITFVKWVVIAAITGLIGGFIGSLFSICLKRSTSLTTEYGGLFFNAYRRYCYCNTV